MPKAVVEPDFSEPDGGLKALYLAHASLPWRDGVPAVYKASDTIIRLIHNDIPRTAFTGDILEKLGQNLSTAEQFEAASYVLKAAIIYNPDEPYYHVSMAKSAVEHCLMSILLQRPKEDIQAKIDVSRTHFENALAMSIDEETTEEIDETKNSILAMAEDALEFYATLSSGRFQTWEDQSKHHQILQYFADLEASQSLRDVRVHIPGIAANLRLD